MQDEVLIALGIETLPVGESEGSLRRKLLSNNFFWNRVVNSLVWEHSLAIAKALPQIERDALRDKLVPPVKKPPVVWALKTPEQTIGGRVSITATCGPEQVNWSGDPRNVRAFRWRGECVPGDLAYLYEQYHLPQMDPIDA